MENNKKNKFNIKNKESNNKLLLNAVKDKKKLIKYTTSFITL